MHKIFHAIHQNDLSAFMNLVGEREWLLEERKDEERINNTVLHVAVELGHRELVSKIIELRPSLVCSGNAFENTPLHLAAVLGDVNIVAQILETNLGLEVCSAFNIYSDTPLILACNSNSIDAAKLIAEQSQSINLRELKWVISNGSTCIAKIILERFPDLAREKAWMVKGPSRSTLMYYACDKGDIELTSILLGLDQGLEVAVNRKGLSPLHLAVLRGSVEILKEFSYKVPLSFSTLTRSNETVFHLAARNKHKDAFVFMAESLGLSSQILLEKTDENGNTALHIAASVACDPSFIRYIVEHETVDLEHKNKMGLKAFQLLPQEAQDFELLSRLLRFGTGSHEEDVIQLLKLIRKESKEASRVARLIFTKEKKVHRDESLEYEMYIEALQNARNMIAIVAVLIASVAYAGWINPPGGVYQDGPLRGKSTVAKAKAFQVFAICNNIALFTSLCIVILLVSIIPYKRKPLKRLLVATHRMMWVSVGFMATAYIAASWVIIPHNNGTRWLFPAIIVVACGVLTLVFLFLGVETIRHWFKKKSREGEIPSFARTSSDLAASEHSGYFTY